MIRTPNTKTPNTKTSATPLEVTCPTCLVPPNVECRTAWGAPAPSMHQSRLNAAAVR